jgi:large subunit ribosomal protein L32
MVVRMRRNRSQTAKRRSHHGISAMRASKCSCGAMRLSHRACPSCGKYNGNIILDIVAQKEREQKRQRRKEKALRESGQLAESKESKS